MTPDEQTVERVAAAMWKAEAVDSGSPESVAMRRTPQEFTVQADETRAKWRKFARAAISAMPDTTQARNDALREAEKAMREECTAPEGTYDMRYEKAIARAEEGTIDVASRAILDLIKEPTA